MLLDVLLTLIGVLARYGITSLCGVGSGTRTGALAGVDYTIARIEPDGAGISLLALYRRDALPCWP